MTNLYELKLGSEKLEALLELFNKTGEIIETLKKVDLWELRNLYNDILNALDENQELLSQAKDSLNENIELSKQMAQMLSDIQNLHNILETRLNEILVKAKTADKNIQANADKIQGFYDEIKPLYDELVTTAIEMKIWAEQSRECADKCTKSLKKVEDLTAQYGGQIDTISAIVGIEWANAYVKDGFLFIGTKEPTPPPYIDENGFLIVNFEE